MPTDSMILTVANRLAKHPPFDRLDPDLVNRVARDIRIRYLEPNEVIFRQGDAAKPEFYVVVKGEIAVTQELDGEPVLIDVCDEGDIFGVRALLAGREYLATTQAKEDTLLYVMSNEALDELMKEPRVALFFAAGFAADLPQTRDVNRLEAVREARRHDKQTKAGDETRRVDPVREVLTCTPETTIRQAAKMMGERNVGSILVVNEERHPLGIVTDSDLRTKVVGEGRDVSGLISEIMSSPVLTIDDQATLSSLIATVMRKHLHHFAVTEDGTPTTAVVGIVSEHDILKTQGSHPTVILNEISRAKTKERLRVLRDQAEELLRRYLEDEVGMGFLSNMISEINDTLIRRAIRLSLQEMADHGLLPPVSFCWLALGSEGREEQLLRTDQDNAILYANPNDTDDGAAARFFLELGERVVDILVEAGFERCPGDVMASNPKWNQPLDVWKRYFTSWIREPEKVAVMHTNIFFDFRPVLGDPELGAALKKHIFEEVEGHRLFLAMQARNAVQNPPPLSFFRNMMVERSGEHRDAFDIKARAMMPLADAARLLIYDFGIDIYGSTAERWEAIAAANDNLARLAGEAAMAYEILMRIRAIEGLTRGTSGRYVHIKELNKLERQTLRNTFSVVKDVQLMLTSRYRIDFLR